jgi:hypothetical protein
MKLTDTISPKALADELGCSRGTIVNASRRADVGIYVSGEYTRNGKAQSVDRLVAIHTKDIGKVKKAIRGTPGNPNFIAAGKSKNALSGDFSTVKE